jgi:hypothetical protein
MQWNSQGNCTRRVQLSRSARHHRPPTRPPWANIDICEVLPILDGCTDDPDPNQGREPWFGPCEYIPRGSMCYHPEYDWCINSVFEICDPPAYAADGDECTVAEAYWRCDDAPIGSLDTATSPVPGGPGPNIIFLSPNDNESVSGEIPVGFTAAHAQVGVHTVKVFVDEQPVTLGDWQERLAAPEICLDPGGQDPACPNIGYVGYLNTRNLSNGTHKIGVMVFDNRIPYQRMTWAERTIRVNNVGCTDTTKPTVSITAPVGGSTVSGTVGVTASAADNVGVTKVNFTVDGSLAMADTTAPYGFTWDASSATVGAHTLQANAFDACGNNRWSAIVTINVPPPAPEIAVTRATDGVAILDGGSASLGSVPVNVATSMRFRIANTGNANLVLTNPAALVTGACFQQIETPSTPIVPGGEAFFRVRLLCAAPGNQSGAVAIGSNDTDENPFDIALSGTVTAPSAAEIALSRAADGVAIADGGAAFLGSTASGVSISQRFRIFNSGTGDLVLANAASLVTGACFQQIETPTTPVLPGGEAFFRVRFLCTAGGTHTGAVTLNSNDADENPYDVVLSGTVTASNPPDIAVARAFDGVAVPDGASVTIGTVAVGTSTSMRFRIANTGTGALAISNASSLVSGICFQQIETPTTPVPAGGEAFFRVRLLCSTAGTALGSVSIVSDDPDESPYDIALTGTVTP